MDGHEHDDRRAYQCRHHLLELLEGDGPVGPEFDDHDRAERPFGLHLFGNGDAIAPLPAHFGIYVDARNVSLKIRLSIEHYRVADGSHMAADEARSTGPGRGR